MGTGNFGVVALVGGIHRPVLQCGTDRHHGLGEGLGQLAGFCSVGTGVGADSPRPSGHRFPGGQLDVLVANDPGSALGLLDSHEAELAAGESALVVLPGSVGGNIDFKLIRNVVLSGGIAGDGAHLDLGDDVCL